MKENYEKNKSAWNVVHVVWYDMIFFHVPFVHCCFENIYQVALKIFARWPTVCWRSRTWSTSSSCGRAIPLYTGVHAWTFRSKLLTKEGRLFRSRNYSCRRGSFTGLSIANLWTTILPSSRFWKPPLWLSWRSTLLGYEGHPSSFWPNQHPWNFIRMIYSSCSPSSGHPTTWYSATTIGCSRCLLDSSFGRNCRWWDRRAPRRTSCVCQRS